MLRELEAQTQRFKQEADRKDALIADKAKAVGELEHTIGSYDDKLKSIEVNLLTIKEEKKTTEEKNE